MEGKGQVLSENANISENENINLPLFYLIELNKGSWHGGVIKEFSFSKFLQYGRF